jgi:hypothetical protein
MSRPSGLIYSNSRRVEVIDPDTMSAVDYFINSASFCNHFGIPKNQGSHYLTKNSARLKMNGMMCRYEGDTYWENLKKKTRKVEVLDMDTLEVKMTFDSTLEFCNYFGMKRSSAYAYLSKNSKRSKFRNTMLVRYEGDDYWERIAKAAKPAKDRDNRLAEIKEEHRQEVKKLKEHIARLNKKLRMKDMEIQMMNIDIEQRNEILVETLSGTDLKIEHIKKTVCNHFRCPESAIDSRSRKAEELWPRHVYSWMIHKRVVQNNISLETIGLMTGDRTHASVINSNNKVNNRIETDRNFRDDISVMLSVYGWGLQVGKEEVELRRI